MKTFFITIFLAISFLTIGQKDQYLFQNFTIKDGISNNVINCIIQDHRGFIWLGTNDGLNRFDGRVFKAYRHIPGNKNSISGNIIRDIYEDKNHVLWIATEDGGITVFDPMKEESSAYVQYRYASQDANSIPNNFVTSIVEDGRGKMWIGTQGNGIVLFDKNKKTFSEKFNDKPKNIMKLFKVSDDELWVGRQGGGLLKINTKDGTASQDVRYTDFYKQLPHMVITSFFKESDNRYWIGSWDKKLYIIDGEYKEEILDHGNGYTDDVASCFIDFDGNNIWIGGEKNGIQIWDTKTKQFIGKLLKRENQNALLSNTIKCMMKDKVQGVWIGTDRGLSYINPRQKKFIQQFVLSSPEDDVIVYDMYFHTSKEIWIGTNKGLVKYNTDRNTSSLVSLTFKGIPLSLTKIYKASTGDIYFGTDFSLFLYKDNKLALLPNTEADKVIYDIISSRIVDIAEDTIDGHRCLIALPYGHFLCYYDFVEKKWYSRLTPNKSVISKLGLRDNLIKKIYKNQDKIILANTKGGIGVWNKINKVNYIVNNPAINGLNNNHIADIVPCNGLLYISTYGGGLHQSDPKLQIISHIPFSPNLLEGISTDRYNQLWMVSGGTVYRLNNHNNSIVKYSLPDSKNTGGVSGKIYQDDTKQLYVCGNNYFIKIESDSFSNDDQSGHLVFSDFKIHNRAFPHLLGDKTIYLKHNQNNIKVEFAVPGIEIGKPIMYAYSIDALHNDWVDIGTQNYIDFSNAAPGKYAIKIKYSYISGIWHDADKILTIDIALPFYKQWWFILLMVMCTLSLIYFIYKLRMRQLKMQQEMRNKISQDLHDHVGARLTGITMYSKVAQIHFDNNQQDELKNLLNIIDTTAKDTISDINDIVWSIKPENDNVEGMLNRMKALLANILPVCNIDYEFLYDDAILKLPLDMALKKNIFLIFKEAINNIVKHADADKVLVKFSLSSKQLLLVIHDNGQGFTAANGQINMGGNGIDNMKKRVAEHFGIFSVDSSVKGTTINVEIPLNNNKLVFNNKK